MVRFEPSECWRFPCLPRWVYGGRLECSSITCIYRLGYSSSGPITEALHSSSPSSNACYPKYQDSTLPWKCLECIPTLQLVNISPPWNWQDKIKRPDQVWKDQPSPGQSRARLSCILHITNHMVWNEHSHILIQKSVPWIACFSIYHMLSYFSP